MWPAQGGETLGLVYFLEVEVVVHVIALSTFGWIVLGIAVLCLWVALAFWPARVAARKGHSFLGYFIFSLFFFPLALLVAYLVGDRTRPAIS
jgi:hypothetical protein